MLRRSLNAGPAQLMMAFTGEGQIKPELVTDRDARYGKNTEELRETRQQKITVPENAPAPAANYWQSAKGKAWQTAMQELDFKQL